MDRTNNIEQPLSLMTINASSKTDDLLIIRVLESSERKMQLIKKLLAPDDYNSIASDLFSQEIVKEPEISLAPVQSNNIDAEEEDRCFRTTHEIHSGISCNNRAQSSNLQENLAKKREALEFFFSQHNQSSNRRQADDNLSIELRAGHYLSLSSTNTEAVIKNAEFSLKDRIAGLLGLMGFSSCMEDRLLNADGTEREDEGLEAEFMRAHKSLDRLPYSRERNVITMKDRLKADGELNKVLCNLATFKESMRRKELTMEHAMIPHFNIAQSIGSEQLFSERVPSLITHHPIVELLLKKISLILAFVKALLGSLIPIKIPANVNFTPQEGHFNANFSTDESPDKLVDIVYRKIFVKEPAYSDSNLKISKLINHVDLGFLMELLGGGRLSKSFFILDPFTDQIGQQPYADEECPLVHRGLVREALLTWRWSNNLNQQVHLSEQENIKTYGVQSDELKSKVKQMIAEKPESGYRLIERKRARAVDYLNRYEVKLREILKVNKERALSRQARIGRTTLSTSLLVEPKLNRIDFSGAVRLAKRLMPRKTARRPLMPKRKRTALQDRAAVTLTRLDLESDLLAGSYTDLINHESPWQPSFVLPAASPPLQLVISIRQAINVPMRVVQQISPSTPFNVTRTNSPFLSAPINQSARAGATSPVGFIQSPSGQIIQQPNYLLAEPTTYIEIVFQRKQQASSLAQGKNPAWNEAFFFPVETEPVAQFNSDAQNDALVDSQKQLVDEYLQFNLYDYRSYPVTRDEPNSSEEVTMALNSSSGIDLSPLASVHEAAGGGFPQPASRTLTSRQRIERNLLGSLRVPLASLLSSGRIEGSFALNPPLFLNDYQYDPEIVLGVPSTEASLFNMAQMHRESNKHPTETYVSLFITLDPPVPYPLHVFLATGSIESDRLFEYARLYERVMLAVSSSFGRDMSNSSKLSAGNNESNRSRRNLSTRQRQHIKVLALQQDAKYCLINRLLMPLKIPEELQTNDEDANLDKQMRILARFVSLLSPLKHGLFSMRSLAASLWFDSAHLLNQCLGGPEEKAALLCNYFLQLGKCSALLLGDSVEDGRCVYVIVWNDQENRLPVSVNEQLQLEASLLLQSSGGFESAQSASARRQPVDGSNLLTRLPILVRDRSIQLWNANSGKQYTLDNQMPLTSVGCIITMENTYANIQSTSNPASINYDIRSKHLWWPLFESSLAGANVSKRTLERLSGRQHQFANRLSKQVAGGLRTQLNQLEAMSKLIGKPYIAPIAIAPIEYDQLSTDECQELQVAIERIVKSSLLKSRADRPTYFNRTISRLLADKLALFEEAARSMSSTSGHKFDWNSEMSDIIRSEILMAQHLSSSSLNARQAIAWPANIPYTSMKAIVDSLFASGVHNADLMLVSVTVEGLLTRTMATHFK